MKPADLTAGEVVYLVPKLPGAPSVAYRQPQVTVLAVAQWEATVRLANGEEITVSLANLARHRPEPDQAEPTRSRTRPELELPNGWQEVTLW